MSTGAGSTGGADLAPETVVRALLIKGFATPDALADVVLVGEEELAPVIAALAAEGLVADKSGMYQLSDEGKAAGEELLASDIEAWGIENAEAALDSFLDLDRRIKEIVTDWQMRRIGSAQEINDHSDADYDARVLDRFETLHGVALGWLEPLTEELGRLALYVARLDRAATRVTECDRVTADCDHMFIASPRVDSYHNVWFELHEDLIRLAGRTREEETAAGRA